MGRRARPHRVTAMQTIHVHPTDDDAAAKRRQEQICERLDQLGASQVRSMIGSGLPTNWNPIIFAWLAKGGTSTQEQT